LPRYASNCGKAGYVDEFVLHEVGNNLGFELATTAGTRAMSFMDDEFVELAQDEKRQSEMKTILFNALLKNEYIGERVSFSTAFKITFFCRFPVRLVMKHFLVMIALKPT
jgi:hypothetical protein